MPAKYPVTAKDLEKLSLDGYGEPTLVTMAALGLEPYQDNLQRRTAIATGITQGRIGNDPEALRTWAHYAKGLTFNDLLPIERQALKQFGAIDYEDAPSSVTESVTQKWGNYQKRGKQRAYARDVTTDLTPQQRLGFVVQSALGEYQPPDTTDPTASDVGLNDAMSPQDALRKIGEYGTANPKAAGLFEASEGYRTAAGLAPSGITPFANVGVNPELTSTGDAFTSDLSSLNTGRSYDDYINELTGLFSNYAKGVY